MAKRQMITQYRERLDRALASPRLTNAESLKSLVKTQILNSSGQETEGCGEKVIEKRTAEVANFLDMLRSVSDKSDDGSRSCETVSQPEWKVKQDNEEYRVMYREGPEGSPIHTLLVEGYVDGPLDVCLCISWESALYAKWWPQSTIPTFKILSCKCLQKVRNGEQISLVRVKVSWPLSTREAIVHYFLFEYFEDDMTVVLLNTVSDSESIDISTDGFTSEAIPEAKDVVRIAVVGGFAMQKVTQDRSYFRTIANMDIKLDFVPPSLINFMSRQLIGNGFRLYQKAVASRFTTDEDFSKALKGSLYARIREALYSENPPNGLVLEGKYDSHEEDKSAKSLAVVVEEHETLEGLVVAVKEEHETLNDSTAAVPEECETSNDLDVSKVVSDNENTEAVVARKTVCEIEELESEESKRFDNKVVEISPISRKRNAIIISSEVEQALGTLEKVISMVRQYGFNAQLRSSFGFAGETALNENNVDEDSKSLEVRVDSDLKPRVEPEKEVTARKSSQESATNSSSITNSRQGGSNSFSKEVNHNKIAPASPEHNLSVPPCEMDTNRVEFSSAKDGSTQISVLNHDTQNYKHLNGSPAGGTKIGKEKRHRFCCFSMIS